MDRNVEHNEDIEALFHHVDLSRCSDEMVTFSQNSRLYIAGYVAKKLKERFGDCYNGLLTGDSGAENPDLSYVKLYQDEVLQSHQQIW